MNKVQKYLRHAGYLLENSLNTIDEDTGIGEKEVLNWLITNAMITQNAIRTYSDYIENGTKEEQDDFIHVFRRIIVEEHMDGKCRIK